jgi:hypothetical protein
MAACLRPAVSGAPRNALRKVIALHGVGLLAGALVMGLVLAVIGSALGSVGLRSVATVVVGLSVVVAVLQVAGLRVPQSPWQVPDYWRRTLDPGVLPIAYGAILGTGIFTAVVVGAFWVFVALTLLFAPSIALLGWIAYAMGRVVGFAVVLQTEPLERIFISAGQRRTLVLATAMFAAIVVAL